MEIPKKMWGKNEFWGMSNEYDPIWLLSAEEKILYDKVIELCRTTIRPHAIECDKNYIYPRKSLEALSELGLLGVIIPKEFGGIGGTHLFAAMLLDAIARYGCPSTCLVYAMHVGATSSLLLRYHNNKTIQDLLRRINKEKLIGTQSYSDPATGGHFWFPMSSKTQKYEDGRVKMVKYGSWCTSSGFADFYVVQTVSPENKGNYSKLNVYLIFKDEARASASDWRAMGMHGNQSGPLTCEGVLTPDRRIGPEGDGALSNDETVDPYFLLLTAAGWNGMAMAAIDIAKRHVTRKFHADTGIRVSDYPTVQDYFGECLTSTNTVRLQVFSIAQMLDKITDNNDWSLHSDLKFCPRKFKLHWLWQSKFEAAKNVTNVVDKMLHACGGSAYREDLGLERILRDAKSSWVMGPSNEFLRQLIGKTSLHGMSAIDYWEQKCQKGILLQESRKMTNAEKTAFAERLLKEVESDTCKPGSEKAGLEDDPLNDSNEYVFDNPFNKVEPLVNDKVTTDSQGVSHGPGLSAKDFTSVKLVEKTILNEDTEVFKFDLPNSTQHTSCLLGQYVQIEVDPKGHQTQQRYVSPISPPDEYGRISIAMKLLTQGVFSNHLKQLQVGDSVKIKGPSGGFEYFPNTLDHLTLICSGAGVTPAIQLLRGLLKNPSDKTKITLLFSAFNPEQLLFREELEAINDKRINIVMSVMEADNDWKGEEGFIDQQMILTHVVPVEKQGKHKIVMCGGPTVNVSVLSIFRDLNYPSENIYIYGCCGTDQVKMVYGLYTPLATHSSSG